MALRKSIERDGSVAEMHEISEISILENNYGKVVVTSLDSGFLPLFKTSVDLVWLWDSNRIADAYAALAELPMFAGSINNTYDVTDDAGNGAAIVVSIQPSVLHVLNTLTGVWELDLSIAKSSRVEVLNAACKAHIYGGYLSNALGEVFHYPAKDLDQSNMVASVTSSLYPGLPEDWATPFWCADVNGEWSYRMHSASQIQKAGSDGKLAIIEALSKNALLLQQVNQASTEEEINQISW